MLWFAVISCLCLQKAAECYKRSPHYPPPSPYMRGSHSHPHHVHVPYSKRHFNTNREHFRGPPFPPKPHYLSAGQYQQSGNHPQVTSSAQFQHQYPHSLHQHQHGLNQYPSSHPHGLQYPSQSHPSPPYPNPNFIQTHNIYQAPSIPAVVAHPAPILSSPTPTPTYLPPPTPYVPPAATYLPAYLKDDDKGPIHTIPAPNLSPADKPAGFDEYLIKNSAAHANLISNNYRIKSYNQYQISEDGGLSKGALFAPDPDPSVPTLKVPPTTDPHSLPSNGQVPLDLYLQQEAENHQLLQEQVLQQQALQQQALQQQALHQQVLSHQVENQGDDSLSPQDLFNLLNYQPNVIPESQLQQHVLQPNVQFYSNPLYLRHSQFMNPHYQTFNYDERTQQSAYGSDTFPLQSLSTYFGNPEDTTNLLDSLNTNEIGKKLDQRDTKKTDQYHEVDKRPYTSLSSKEVADALATLSAAGALNNADQKLTNNEDNNDDEIMKQEENKNALYESSFPKDGAESDNHARKIEPDTEASNFNLIKSEKLADFDVNLENQSPNGNRVRPKRY